MSDSIQKALHKANEEDFHPRGIKIDFLKNCQAAIPLLAEWLYAEWRPYDTTLTKEKLLTSFSQRLNDDRLPLTLVALKDKKPVGTISLKDKCEAELADLAKGNPWIGSLQVVCEERNLGLGHDLLSAVKPIALCLGHPALFVYSSNPANRDWYCKRGADFIETRPFRHHTIEIMKISL